MFAEHGVSWASVFDKKPLDAEEINKWLVAYGCDMHAAGKSYTRSSETINAMLAPDQS